MNKLRTSQKMTLGAMIVALTVVLLYATAIVPNIKLFCLFAASMLTFVLTCEGAYASALIAFAASSLLSFLLVRNQFVWGAYILLFGHYGIFKTFLDQKELDPVIYFAIRMIYCNVFAAIGVVIVQFLLGLELSELLLVNIPMWLIVVIAEAAFIFFDFLYTMGQKLYYNRIRSFLLPRR